MATVQSIYFPCFFILLCAFANSQNVTENEIRPYEFTFNIVDFQHRSERKDDDGLITGEYGFITADGIYHETAYTVDETGDFIVTKMRHRRIASFKDAQEIFKDNPEQAKMLSEALVKSCTGCGATEMEGPELAGETSAVPTIVPKKSEIRMEKKLDLAMKEMMKVLNKKSESSQKGSDNAEDKFSRREKKLSGLSNRSGKELNPSINGTTNEIIRDMVDAAKKVFQEDGTENEREGLTSAEVLEKMANDLFYRFNYTITSHAHREDGFRDGRKDGEYNAKFKEGIDTHVKYTSNEFGHQPNITLVPSHEDGQEGNDTTTEKPYKGHYFNWFSK